MTWAPSDSVYTQLRLAYDEDCKSTHTYEGPCAEAQEYVASLQPDEYVELWREQDKPMGKRSPFWELHSVTEFYCRYYQQLQEPYSEERMKRALNAELGDIAAKRKRPISMRRELGASADAIDWTIPQFARQFGYTEQQVPDFVDGTNRLMCSVQWALYRRAVEEKYEYFWQDKYEEAKQQVEELKQAYEEQMRRDVLRQLQEDDHELRQKAFTYLVEEDDALREEALYRLMDDEQIQQRAVVLLQQNMPVLTAAQVQQQEGVMTFTFRERKRRKANAERRQMEVDPNL
jgi:hypothetical protein